MCTTACVTSTPNLALQKFFQDQQNVFQKNGFKCTLVKQLIAMVSFESKPLVFLAQLMYIVTAIKEYEDTYIFIYKTGTYFVIIFKWAF